jgi:hypothetical protein
MHIYTSDKTIPSINEKKFQVFQLWTTNFTESELRKKSLKLTFQTSLNVFISTFDLDWIFLPS